MTTPLFKLLANSIRLGQPPEPVTAIRALVEVIGHQDAEMNELRQRVSLLTSRLQFFEAKIARLEAISLQGAPQSSAQPYIQSFESSQGPAPREPTRIGGYQGLTAPSHLPKAEPLPARAERPRSQHPPAFAELQNTDDPRDGEAGGTLVVLREDIDAVVRSVVENEAPYPLALPGGHTQPPEHLSAMPFKPAQSQPPPPMVLPAAVQRGGLRDPGSRRQEARPPQSNPAMKSAEESSPREPKLRASAARESYSDPYVVIESDDTFSSTAEIAAANASHLAERGSALTPTTLPGPPRNPSFVPTPHIAEAEPDEARRQPMSDELSFDEVLTGIHNRKI